MLRATPARSRRIEDQSSASGFVAAGARFSCARLDTGRVRCWGIGIRRARLRQHADIGDTRPGRSARRPRRRTNGRAISAGFYHACAILDQGQVRCWGSGDDGALGYGNTSRIGDNETPGSVGPVDLGAGRTAVAITGGGRHTCAILDNGKVRCWGCGSRASSATATRGASATTRRRARSGRSTSARTHGGGDHGRRLPHLRDPRQRQGALLGRGQTGPARLRQQEDIGDNETPGSVGPGEARRGAKGRRDLGRLQAHLRDPRQRQGALLGPRVKRPARLRQHEEDRRRRDARLGRDR